MYKFKFNKFKGFNFEILSILSHLRNADRRFRAPPAGRSPSVEPSPTGHRGTHDESRPLVFRNVANGRFGVRRLRPSVRATSQRARGNGRGATDANAAFVAFSFRSNARDGPASDHATAAARGEADENLARRFVVIARVRDDGR